MFSANNGFLVRDATENADAEQQFLSDADAIVASCLDHLADGAMGAAEATEVGADRSDVIRCNHQHEADAAIERAPHFIVRDRAFALQPVEHRRQHDRRSLDVEAEAVGDRDVAFNRLHLFVSQFMAQGGVLHAVLK